MPFHPVYTLTRRHWIATSLHETFEFFQNSRNLPRITPPGLGLRILTPDPIVMTRGLTIDYRVRVLGLPSHWRSAIVDYEPPSMFRDVQLVGPYRRWDHRHRFWEEDGGTVIEDVVVYQLPLGPLAIPLHGLLVRRQLDAIFDYRAMRIDELLGRLPLARAVGEPS